MTRYWPRALGWTGLVAVLSAALLCVANAAEVTLGLPVTTTDGALAVSVTVAPVSQEAVAALQLDLHYDASQYKFTDLATGNAAVLAGKDAAFSEPSPGVVRVVVAGMNQESLAAGTVATLYFQPLGKTEPTASFSQRSSMDEVVLSDPFGEAGEAVVVNAAATQSDAATESHTDKNATATSASSQTTAEAKQATPSSPISSNSDLAPSQGQGVLPGYYGGAGNSAAQLADPKSIAKDIVRPAARVAPGEYPIPVAGDDSPRTPQTPGVTQTSNAGASNAPERTPAARRIGPDRSRPASSEGARLLSSGPDADLSDRDVAGMQIAKRDSNRPQPASLATAQEAGGDRSMSSVSRLAVYGLLGASVVALFFAWRAWTVKRS